MEQLQRQQEAKLEMDRQAQLLFAKHVAAARASGSRLDPTFLGKREDRETYQTGQQSMDGNLSNMDPEMDDEERDQGSDEDGEEQEMAEEIEEDEGEEEDEKDGPLHLTKTPRLQQDPASTFSLPYSTSPSPIVKQLTISPPSTVKQEPENKDLLSPVGQHSFTSPNGFTDWGYDELFKQVRSF